MLPSLSKHFIKAMLKPLIRGATPEEMYAAKYPQSQFNNHHVPLSKDQWLAMIPELTKRRGQIHRTLNRPQGATPTKEQVVAAYRAM